MGSYGYTLEYLMNKYSGYEIVLRSVDDLGDLLLTECNESEYLDRIVDQVDVCNGYLNVYLL